MKKRCSSKYCGRRYNLQTEEVTEEEARVAMAQRLARVAMAERLEVMEEMY